VLFVQAPSRSRAAQHLVMRGRDNGIGRASAALPRKWRGCGLR
jgi:hypothetical protein